MYYLKIHPVVLVSILMLGCGTGSGPGVAGWDGAWKTMGLDGQQIVALEVSEEYLFAADKTGIFRQRRSEKVINWEALDLPVNADSSEVSDLLLTGEGLYAAIRSTVSTEEIPDGFRSLYRSTDDGDSWELVEINSMDGQEKPYVISRLAKCCSGLLYSIGGAGRVYVSEDGGSNWQGLDHEGAPQFIYVSEEHPNQIWIGGQTPSFIKYLEASKDFGETWTTFLNDGGGAVYSVTVSPEDEEVVLAGMRGPLQKSEDGGQSWRTVLQRRLFYTFANSRVHTGRVYASGWNPERKGVFVLYSEDFGDTWDVREYRDGLSDIPANDLVPGMEDGEEVIYLGTDNGVYGFRLQ